MSDLRLTSTIQVQKGNLQFTGSAINLQTEIVTGRTATITVDVATSEAEIEFGDVVPGYVRVLNLDATNFVRLRFATTANAIRIPAGGFAVFYLDGGVSLFAIADTAGCRVQVDAVNV